MFLGLTWKFDDLGSKQHILGLNKVGKDQNTPEFIIVRPNDDLDLRAVIQSTVRNLAP